MTVSVFELFSVGVGPSSSHTVGPMRAAARFVGGLRTIGALADVSDIRVDLYGSLAATGAGHGTMPAVLLGLEGFKPETIETEQMEHRLEEMRASREIQLGGERAIKLAEDEIVLHPRTVLPFHPNGMTMTASSTDNVEVHTETYFSIGGGFVSPSPRQHRRQLPRSRGCPLDQRRNFSSSPTIMAARSAH
jgi:L-serine dehydratase